MRQVRQADPDGTDLAPSVHPPPQHRGVPTIVHLCCVVTDESPSQIDYPGDAHCTPSAGGRVSGAFLATTGSGQLLRTAVVRMSDRRFIVPCGTIAYRTSLHWYRGAVALHEWADDRRSSPTRPLRTSREDSWPNLPWRSPCNLHPYARGA
jgi:hypothetical protein